MCMLLYIMYSTSYRTSRLLTVTLCQLCYWRED